MIRWMNRGAIGAVALLIVLGLTVLGVVGGQASTAEPASPAPPAEKKIFTVGWLAGAPQPAETDIVECNDYAAWVAEREARLDRAATENNAGEPTDDHARPALATVGTLHGLSSIHRDDPHAEAAYRQCMLRRGYNVWG
jgi:hypothetical protein